MGHILCVCTCTIESMRNFPLEDHKIYSIVFCSVLIPVCSSQRTHVLRHLSLSIKM